MIDLSRKPDESVFAHLHRIIRENVAVPGKKTKASETELHPSQSLEQAFNMEQLVKKGLK